MSQVLNLRVGVPTIVHYRNHRGELAIRRIIPLGSTWFGTSSFHKTGPMWFIDGWDVVKGAQRTFSLQDMQPPPEGTWLCDWCGWFGQDTKKRMVDGAAGLQLEVCPKCDRSVAPY